MKKFAIRSLILAMICTTCTMSFASKTNPIRPAKSKAQATQFDYIKQLISWSLGSNQCIPIEEIIPAPETTEINNAIKKGNASELAQYFNTAIEIAIPNNEGTYSKVQAQMILSMFFDKYPVKSFIVMQEGSSANNTNFVIGTYITLTSKNFRVYYVTKKVGNKELIQHLEFELK
jgi:hypothetical protein